MKLGDGEAVNLAFRDDDLLPALLPEVLTEELETLGGADPAELFAVHTQVLGSLVAMLVVVRSHMTEDAVISGDAVAEKLAGLLSKTTLGERTEGHVKKIGD